MTTRVFIAGLLPHLMDDFSSRLAVPEIDLISGTGVEELSAAFADADIDHVIIGGGLRLPARLDMVRTVFESSDRAPVPMKGHRSGPEAFVPFVRAGLQGLADYHPAEAQRAV